MTMINVTQKIDGKIITINSNNISEISPYSIYPNHEYVSGCISVEGEGSVIKFVNNDKKISVTDLRENILKRIKNQNLVQPPFYVS